MAHTRTPLFHFTISHGHWATAKNLAEILYLVLEIISSLQSVKAYPQKRTKNYESINQSESASIFHSTLQLSHSNWAQPAPGSPVAASRCSLRPSSGCDWMPSATPWAKRRAPRRWLGPGSLSASIWWQSPWLGGLGACFCPAANYMIIYNLYWSHVNPP